MFLWDLWIICGCAHPEVPTHTPHRPTQSLTFQKILHETSTGHSACVTACLVLQNGIEFGGKVRVGRSGRFLRTSQLLPVFLGVVVAACGCRVSCQCGSGDRAWYTPKGCFFPPYIQWRPSPFSQRKSDHH